MILAIDVDYPYASRFRSFLSVFLGVKFGSDYLLNEKTIAKMINDSPKKVHAYWFFVSKVPPDETLKLLLSNPKHTIGLHIVKNSLREQKILEEAIGKKIQYYTLHGTNRLSKFVWKSFAKPIVQNPPLMHYSCLNMYALDQLKNRSKTAQALQEKGAAFCFHPIWLFQNGKYNRRGRFYECLKAILK